MKDSFYQKTKCIIELYDDRKMTCIGLREWECNNIVSRTLYLIFIKIMFRILCLGILRLHSKIEYIECGLREAKLIKVISNEEVFVEEIMYLHLIESHTKSIDIMEWENEDEGVNFKKNYFRYFIHKKLRYYWSEKNQIFLEIQGLDNILTTEEIYSCSTGLSNNEFKQRLKLHGLNKMEVEVSSYFKLYMNELLDPFCLVQIISIIIWCCDDYYVYAITIFCILMITISINTYHVKNNLTRLHKMVYVCTTINVLQENGDFIPKDSVELVPGDVIRVPGNGSIIPCDCVLISGNCVVNESMLTGECFPTTKTSLPLNEFENSHIAYSTQTCKNNTLFSGTTVSQLRSYEHTHVLAFVINTGFCTYKGRMIHSVIFPKLIKFAFFRDSLKFIALLAAMSLAGVIYCIYIFVKMEGTYSLIIRKSLDMITLLIPPCLPAALAVATIYSTNRLKWFGISCIDTTRINVCGKLKMFCFDKTGTLTEEYITISGVLDTQSIGLIDIEIKQFVFNKRIATTVHNMDNKNILYCMAACHSLYNIDGKLAGDPIDTVMFESTQWTLNNNEENDSNNQVEFAGLNIKTVEPPLFSQIQLSNESTSENTHMKNTNSGCDIKLDKVFHSFSLLKTYQFESVLQRMTVITKDIEDNQIIIFSKGSPETIQKLCTPESIPKDFQKVLFFYAEKGYRILGMACKFLDKSQPWHKTMMMKRTEIEKDMVFLGFLLLHNKLKPKSADVVNYLTSLNTRMCMVTGDNMLTALSIGCECGIISIDQSIIQVHAVVNVSCKDKKSKELKIKYTEHQYSNFVFQSNSDLLENENVLSVSDMIPNSNNRDSKKIKNSSGTSNHNLKQLVIDGESFDLIKTYETQENYEKLLVSGVIFARMSPQQKTTLVKDLQSLGYVVAMVGDGANDCGALKAAHAGIALAMSEASVVSPFTTKDGCLSCIPTLLSEGRTSLTTAFSMFKFILMYSFTQFTSVLILYHCHTVFSNGKFLFVDIFLLGPIISTMLNLAPAKFMHKKRPLGRLAHPLIFFSLFGYFALQLGLHLFVIKMVKGYQWFVPIPYVGGEELESISQENTAIFCSLNFLYIFSSIAVSFGPPHRRFFISNKNYLLSLFVTVFASIVLLLFPGTILQDLISLDDIPSFKFRLFIMCVSICVGICVIIWEYALNYSSIVRKYANLFRFKKGQRNQYKAVVNEILSDKSWPSDSVKPILDYEDSQNTLT